MEDIQATTPQQSAPATPTAHAPVHEWTNRMPSPPHLVVPPFPLEQDAEWNLIPSRYSEFQAGDYARVSIEDLQIFYSALDWRYELRRKAQAVLPFLYLGPFNAARDRDWLRTVGVTMLLHIRETSSSHTRFFDCSAVARDLGITSLTLDVTGHSGLMACFPTAIHAINRHMSASQRPVLDVSAFSAFGDAEATGKVLVFCESGNEKSAAVVAAYLMAVYDLSIVQALQLIQIQRFSVSIDEPMKQMLLSFSSILEAKRDVLRTKIEEKSSASFGGAAITTPDTRPQLPPLSTLPNGIGPANKVNKRTVDDFYDGEDVSMDSVASHDDVTGQRPGFAPFRG
ncbi:phosphatases II [Xylona heveae TC161]|uniref:Phosphatases II n=1 Tax=Xylona heveae (strain CBS 132557 / TC161) TaxID=1328760 RepID=A0A165HGK3_XYLHT|nr:phosphatases II [Xylona heveae TC161]KZF23481.1 phosphatases II [Xylona heveae TC161]